MPTRIRVCSLDSPGPLPAEWAPIEIEWGRHATQIRISRSTLALPPRLSRSEANRGQVRSGDSEAPSLRIDDLVDRHIWSGEVGIDNAAHELGMSVTTLKRRLAELDTSYSSLVEKRRYRWAKHLLSESELPIHKVARGLGYKHQSNFSRAFVRMAGVSPREFRRAHSVF